MTRFLLALALLSSIAVDGFAFQQLVGDEASFPYEALVLRDKAEVRSGPAFVHYATDRLDQGAVVEVYRHDPNGWCAIRPPEGSFSLIPDSVLVVEEDGLGRVTSNTAQAWVGTRLGAVEKPLWQIRLNKDEQVEILGQVSWPDPEGHSTLWYQISPPSGEFRWIQLSDLQLPSTATNLPLEEAPQALTQIDGFLDSPKPVNSPAGTLTTLRDRYQATMRDRDQASSPAPARMDSEVSLASHQMNEELNPSKLSPSQRTQARPNSVQHAIHTAEESAMADTLPDRPAKALNEGWRASTRSKTSYESIQISKANGPPNQFSSPALPSSNESRFESFPVEPSSNPIQLAAAQEPVQTPAPPQLERFADAKLEFNPNLAVSSPNASRLPTKSELQSDIVPLNASPSVALRALEMKLTSEMLKSPVDWKLDELVLQTQTVIDRSADPLVTQHGNRLMKKLKDCKTLRGQYRTAYNQTPSSNLDDRSPVSRRAIGTGVDAEVEFGTTYDGYGWLNELIRNNGSSPATFVLQDEKGNVTHHLTPAPGLNLRLYLKKKIGVIGQRGFHRDLNLKHVTVERVVQLQPN